jgi:hypothetical protein
MKTRLLTLLAAIVMLSMVMPGAVFAQAYQTSFTTSITYQNVGTGNATVVVEFYPSPTSTTPIVISRPALAPNASTSLFVGGLTEIASGFRGSAVMQSDQPLLATMVQLPQGTSPGTRNRPLSNGFSDGGSEQVLVATVLKNMFSTNTIFSIQNTGMSAATVTFRFYNTSATEVHNFQQTIQPGAAYYTDAGTLAGLGTSFNGSAVVTAPAGGSIVGGVMELSTTGSGASAFEGVGAGASLVYMPSALCAAFGADTAYAVQNTNLTTPTSVTVRYSNGINHTLTVAPGAKQSFVACNAPGMPTGFSGSATIESTATPIIAIGKAYGSGLSTAFVGVPAGAGGARIGLPYVRWATDANYTAGTQQRVFLTIQNIGATSLPAGAVTVRYINMNGVEQGTHTLGAIPAGGKLNSNANLAGLTEFGITNGTFGGGAIVEGPSGAQLAVVARVSTQIAPGQFASEDYNGMPLP